MTDILLIKSHHGLVPFSEIEADKLTRYKLGAIIKAEVSQVRNSAFHRKFFAMLDIGYDAFEPEPQDYKGLPAQKNRERFREDCTIAAGFYDVTYDLSGKMHLKAKSISFARMKEAQFEKLYSAVANVLLQKVLTRYTRADLDEVVDRLISFC